MLERGPEQLLPRSERVEEKILLLDKKRIELLNQSAEIKAKIELLQANPANCNHVLFLKQDLERLNEEIENVTKTIKELGADWV